MPAAPFALPWASALPSCCLLDLKWICCPASSLEPQSEQVAVVNKQPGVALVFWWTSWLLFAGSQDDNQKDWRTTVSHSEFLGFLTVWRLDSETEGLPVRRLSCCCFWRTMSSPALKFEPDGQTTDIWTRLDRRLGNGSRRWVDRGRADHSHQVSSSSRRVACRPVDNQPAWAAFSSSDPPRDLDLTWGQLGQRRRN